MDNKYSYEEEIKNAENECCEECGYYSVIELRKRKGDSK
jgi:hypothetical protein